MNQAMFGIVALVVDNPFRSVSPPPEGWACFSARELGETYAARLREIVERRRTGLKALP